MSISYHQPVLLKETISALNISSEEVYVDATLGGGGHARAILEKLGPRGRLIAFDQDKEAWGNVADERLTLAPENFRHLERFLKLHQAIPVAGILADLGVSSHQFDTAERGFSIRGKADAELDMRMDQRQAGTAADILQQYSEQQLWQLFEKYGEVRNARTLAQRIVQARKTFPLKTVSELKAVITPLIIGNSQRYLAQVFQSLRIAVNDELGALEDMLNQAVRVLKPGGRIVVITFHSVEDRMVKNFMRMDGLEKSAMDVLQRQEEKQTLKLVFKKPITPSAEELKANPRSRSAKLRVAEKRVAGG